MGTAGAGRAVGATGAWHAPGWVFQHRGHRAAGLLPCLVGCLRGRCAPGCHTSVVPGVWMSCVLGYRVSGCHAFGNCASVDCVPLSVLPPRVLCLWVSCLWTRRFLENCASSCCVLTRVPCLLGCFASERLPPDTRLQLPCLPGCCASGFWVSTGFMPLGTELLGCHGSGCLGLVLGAFGWLWVALGASGCCASSHMMPVKAQGHALEPLCSSFPSGQVVPLLAARLWCCVPCP